MDSIPLGKLPPDLLKMVLKRAPVSDPRLVLGPGIGLDCAVLAFEKTCLVFKSDPITFASDEIGWYVVQINANDIATTGAIPRWFLMTLLLPEGLTNPKMVESISEQVFAACRTLSISVIGGHTEITHDLDRPIIAGTMIGEVTRDKLITPKGASPGDRILLTKGVPIEGTAILGREFPSQLGTVLSPDEIQTAADYLYTPGISVVRDAQVAVAAGGVTAMHDPTEGGLAGALWELAEACGHSLVIDPEAVIIPPIAQKICIELEIDPMWTIASGALLLTSPQDESPMICRSLESEGIPCAEIGSIESGPPQVLQKTNIGAVLLPRPSRDEIARLFEV